ncbi:MAG: DUF3987 domain-containing protein [Desulfurellales bacterium]|nr:MAG: DUF3987 domain-containing protein [Desulfurellales bacterium]
MTNIDKWRLYNRDIFSPAQYVDWSWYMTVAAALERRVMLDNETNPIFPNLYVLFVAPAGVGKGMAMDRVGEFLRHWRNPRKKSAVQVTIDQIMSGHPDAVEYLFHLAPDSTTFESLIREMSSAPVPKIENLPDGRTYVHSSMTFILDEFTSIFKLHADDLITFLLTVWSGKNYSRRTKGRGHDWLQNPCLNLFSCTTPSEFAKVLRKEIIGSGILARHVIIYEQVNPRRGIKVPAPDPEQVQARDELLNYVRSLKQLCTVAKYSPEAEEYLAKWYDDPVRVRVNTSHKLDEYYVRKLTHVSKMATVLHFSEPGHEKPISAETVERAIKVLDTAERNMHIPLISGGRNELQIHARHVVAYLQQHPQGATYQDLLVQFITDVTHEELVCILTSLREQRQI